MEIQQLRDNVKNQVYTETPKGEARFCEDLLKTLGLWNHPEAAEFYNLCYRDGCLRGYQGILETAESYHRFYAQPR